MSTENTQYQSVAASQEASELKNVKGYIGDILAGILVTPTSLSPGAVTILDGTISINIFAGGASSLSTLHPFYIPLGIASKNGPWSVTTGANLSVVASGTFK